MAWVLSLESRKIHCCAMLRLYNLVRQILVLVCGHSYNYMIIKRAN